MYAISQMLIFFLELIHFHKMFVFDQRHLLNWSSMTVSCRKRTADRLLRTALRGEMAGVFGKPVARVCQL